ncbi:MAG: hypothetical protein ACYTG1_11310, partial [Planctomycetota bacterium]
MDGRLSPRRAEGGRGAVTGLVVLVLLLVTTAGAQTTRPATQPATDANPAAPGFDAEGSDPEAIALADAIMEALGGRAAWDATRYLSWNFFGARRHVWDRHTGDVRIEGRLRRGGGQPYVILMNVRTGDGRVWRDGAAVEDPAELAEALAGGRRLWVNDSYWLVMPYKLKDDGVTLRSLGRRETDEGAADVLELTFRDVGVTPENRYEVHVDPESRLVTRWDFFEKRDDDEP